MNIPKLMSLERKSQICQALGHSPEVAELLAYIDHLERVVSALHHSVWMAARVVGGSVPDIGEWEP